MPWTVQQLAPHNRHVYQLGVFVHILGAIVWVGGMLFLALVAVPALGPLAGPERARLLAGLGRRFRTVGWIAVALLLVTGLFNSAFRGVTWESLASGRLFESWFGRAFAIKLALVATMLIISVLHDFVVGPASVRALEGADPTTDSDAARLRRQASWLARVNTLLALLVVGLAVALVRGSPW